MAVVDLSYGFGGDGLVGLLAMSFLCIFVVLEFRVLWVRVSFGVQCKQFD